MKTARLFARNVSPVHAHDCAACVFLGRLDGADLYYCPNGTASLLYRHGSEGPAYGSMPLGMPFPKGSVYSFIMKLLQGPQDVRHAWTTAPREGLCRGAEMLGMA